MVGSQRPGDNRIGKLGLCYPRSDWARPSYDCDRLISREVIFLFFAIFFQFIIVLIPLLKCTGQVDNLTYLYINTFKLHF